MSKRKMTEEEQFWAFAHVIEQNARYRELAARMDEDDLTDDELDEITDLVDSTAWSPFLMNKTCEDYDPFDPIDLFGTQGE